ncbi:MarR family transcriptional regulator [Rhodococcus pyridinivorans]|uniref:MarR family transcriptional regulator n=1 Tax=Rhodococcus pyridinivorans TaxID=103816 RepID=UPI0020C68A5D|nr:MarR family transcriptional regulator [Rhodococcus pyridinivorans]UTM38034.1 MarR family transcriptional regulator [Rhodococcus pyridinivorans]
MSSIARLIVRRGRDSAELPTPPEFLAMPGYVIRRLNQAYSAAWLRYVGSDLTGPQFAVMLAIKSHPGVEQGSLAKAAALDRSTMVGVVRRLETRKLIVRVQPPEDGRKRLLHLTEEGAVLLEEVNKKARHLDMLLLDGMDPISQDSMWQRLNERADLWEKLVTE